MPLWPLCQANSTYTLLQQHRVKRAKRMRPSYEKLWETKRPIASSTFRTKDRLTASIPINLIAQHLTVVHGRPGQLHTKSREVKNSTKGNRETCRFRFKRPTCPRTGPTSVQIWNYQLHVHLEANTVLDYRSRWMTYSQVHPFWIAERVQTINNSAKERTLWQVVWWISRP